MCSWRNRHQERLNYCWRTFVDATRKSKQNDSASRAPRSRALWCDCRRRCRYDSAPRPCPDRAAREPGNPDRHGDPRCCRAAPQAPPPSITFNALLDGYYVYNFNKPKNTSGAPGSNGPGSRNYDQADNSFSLGLAEIGIAKAVNDASRLGFTVKLAYGPTADAVASSIDQNNKNILQAYGTYLIPAGGKDLTVDAGKFVTHMGYEVIEPELNWNYSRSDLFQYFVPLYHAGVRASYPVSPKFTVNGYVENGWNNVSSDNNVSKAYGFELTYTPSSKYSIILNGLTSSEPDSYGIIDIPPVFTANAESFTAVKPGEKHDRTDHHLQLLARIHCRRRYQHRLWQGGDTPQHDR